MKRPRNQFSTGKWFIVMMMADRFVITNYCSLSGVEEKIPLQENENASICIILENIVSLYRCIDSEYVWNDRLLSESSILLPMGWRLLSFSNSCHIPFCWRKYSFFLTIVLVYCRKWSISFSILFWTKLCLLYKVDY